LIFDANENMEVHRIKNPDHILRIRYCFITEEFDLMILCETIDKYELYMIDLDYYEDEVNKIG
jgi:hypothetical protein